VGSPNGQACLNEAFAALHIAKPVASTVFVRHASHKAQGAVNKAKDGPGKRLGAKKSGEQYVIPGNIIFRQRGTHWFPGENCAMGRDHTIYATESGYVKYYADPERHPTRKYIGVTFKREQVLPLPRNTPRRRRLGVVPSQIEAEAHEEAEADVVVEDAGAQVQVRKEVPRIVELKQKKGQDPRILTLRPGYMYRESNWEIGRAAEKAKIKVKEFKPKDRWTAWRKTVVRKAKNAERRGLSRKSKK